MEDNWQACFKEDGKIFCSDCGDFKDVDKEAQEYTLKNKNARSILLKCSPYISDFMNQIFNQQKAKTVFDNFDNNK